MGDLLGYSRVSITDQKADLQADALTNGGVCCPLGTKAGKAKELRHRTGTSIGFYYG